MDHERYPYYFYQPGKEPFRSEPDALSVLGDKLWNALRRALAATEKPVDSKSALNRSE